MCRFVVMYGLRTDGESAGKNFTTFDDEESLERSLASLRASSATTTIKVFTLSQVLERVPSWVERDPNDYVFATKASDTAVGSASDDAVSAP